MSNSRDEHERLKQVITALARSASIEANVHDTHLLESCAPLITPGTRMYVSHLPNQRWAGTCATSAAVAALGFNAVPHIPVRLLENERELHALLDTLSTQARVEELLLISGDYSQACGPYSSVAQVLEQFPFMDYGIKTLSLAGHPEGHPQVAMDIIRQAERDKCQLASTHGYQCRLVTQFFFESRPFLDWAQDNINHHVAAQRIAGIAGPASIARLFKFAMRCGIGPSIRALGVRPGSLMKLLGDYSPDALLTGLARARVLQPGLFDGMHVFCFGGLLPTCRWLHALAQQAFDLDNHDNIRGNIRMDT